jgi:hypothetical protein
MRGVTANRRRTADTPNLAAQEQSVSRMTVAEVPLTGLSFDRPPPAPDGSFLKDSDPSQEPKVATIEELISVLLSLLPEAEVRIDASGEVVFHTGLTAPAEPALTKRRATA